MLARWLRYKEESVKGPKKRRPYLAELCDDLHEAEKWRGTIIKDISRNVAEIQNASLGEHRIRDINDRINKLFREKRHWERRIRNLGGKDYNKSNKGYGGYGHGAYLYFGAAKDLPGVRQLFNENNNNNNLTNNLHLNTKQKYINKDRVTQKEKKSRMEMLSLINADYYGFGDDDNKLFLSEKNMQQKLRKVKIEKWKKENKQKWNKLQFDIKQKRKRNNDNNNNNNNNNDNQRRKRVRLTKISGYVPSQEEIDKMILEKRKELLLQKYVGDGGNGDTEEGKSLAKSIQIQKIQKRLINEKDDDQEEQEQEEEEEEEEEDVDLVQDGKE